LKAASGGGPINLKDLGLGDINELIETMEENEKAVEEMEKPWEQKLEEER
jgi:signal recognition particle GTPase